jgi:hypothetical protein
LRCRTIPTEAFNDHDDDLSNLDDGARDDDAVPATTTISFNGRTVQISGTHRDFCQTAGPDIDAHLLNFALKDVEEDLAEKVDSISSACGSKRGGPAIPFLPMTREAKEVFAPGKITYPRFLDMFAFHPREAFWR